MVAEEKYLVRTVSAIICTAQREKQEIKEMTQFIIYMFLC